MNPKKDVALEEREQHSKEEQKEVNEPKEQKEKIKDQQRNEEMRWLVLLLSFPVPLTVASDLAAPAGQNRKKKSEHPARWTRPVRSG